MSSDPMDSNQPQYSWRPVWGLLIVGIVLLGMARACRSTEPAMSIPTATATPVQSTETATVEPTATTTSTPTTTATPTATPAILREYLLRKGGSTRLFGGQAPMDQMFGIDLMMRAPCPDIEQMSFVLTDASGKDHKSTRMEACKLRIEGDPNWPAPYTLNVSHEFGRKEEPVKEDIHFFIYSPTAPFASVSN